MNLVSVSVCPFHSHLTHLARPCHLPFLHLHHLALIPQLESIAERSHIGIHVTQQLIRRRDDPHHPRINSRGAVCNGFKLRYESEMMKMQKR